MLYLPCLVGIATNSYIISPSTPLDVTFVLSITLGSYLSNSIGKSTLGCFNNFKFPFPFTRTCRVRASPTLLPFPIKLAEIAKCPTPPEKFCGALGKGNTVKSKVGDFITFSTSSKFEPPFKNSSIGSTDIRR